MLISDCVQADPGLGPTRTQLEAQTLAGKTQPQRQLFNILSVAEQHITSRGDQGQATVGGAHQQAFEATDIADIQQRSQYHRTIRLSPGYEAPGQVESDGAHNVLTLLDQSSRGSYPDQLIISQHM